MLYVCGHGAEPEPATAERGRPGRWSAARPCRACRWSSRPYGTHHGDRHEQGRPGVADRARRTPDNIKNHPALKGLTIPRTGRQGRIGVLTTKTLLIAGEGGFTTTPEGRGAMLRAYNKATGEEVGQVYMPAPQTGSPMTYSVNGTQYIAVAVSGPGSPASCWFTNSPRNSAQRPVDPCRGAGRDHRGVANSPGTPPPRRARLARARNGFGTWRITCR